MSRWIQINPGDFSESKREQIGGVTVEVFLSPYDIPKAVRGSFNKDQNKFLIEFKYIGGEEQLDAFEQDKNVVFYVGRFSKRLVRIEFPLEMKKGSSIGLRLVQTPAVLPRISDALSLLASERESMHLSNSNREVARSILDSRKKELSQTELQPAQ